MAATIGELLAEARRALEGAPFRPSTREAALLLGRVLGLGEARLLTRRDEPVSPAEEARFRALLRRRLTGEPVAYLLGEKEFYGRPFLVDRRVLIPRPETEHLVESALALELPPRPWILDLGTGSGCLAITLAAERPEVRALATDTSVGALAVASRNRRRHGVADRVHLAAADLARGLDLGRFDLVVSNPPYVAPADAPLLSPEVRDFEPSAALFAAAGEGSILIRLLEELRGLRPGASLLLEIGYGQAEPLRRLVSPSAFSLVEIRPDYAGIPRIVVLRRRREEAGG